jgi:hypothetical protein
VLDDCGGWNRVAQGHYWFDKLSNSLGWKLPYVRSHDSHSGTVYGYANITLAVDPNITVAMPDDAQSKRVAVEWTYSLAGKLVPELQFLGVLAGHNRAKTSL